MRAESQNADHRPTGNVHLVDSGRSEDSQWRGMLRTAFCNRFGGVIRRVSGRRNPPFDHTQRADG